jgi:hypothetical protein
MVADHFRRWQRSVPNGLMATQIFARLFQMPAAKEGNTH